MFINANHAQASNSLSYGWTPISAKGAPRTIAEALKEQGYDVEKNPIKVDVSREAIEKYRQMLQSNKQESSIKIVYGQQQPPKDPVTYGENGCPEKEAFVDQLDYHKMINGKINQNDYYFNPYISMKDKVSMLLEAYGKSYDEIIKGYENGTREKYIIDMDAEGYYRKATMEEELALLHKELEEHADTLERYTLKTDCFIRRVDAENADKWVAMGISGLGEAAKAKAFYEHMKEEEKLTNLKQKLMDAANLFISQYQQFGGRRFNVVV